MRDVSDIMIEESADIRYSGSLRECGQGEADDGWIRQRKRKGFSGPVIEKRKGTELRRQITGKKKQTANSCGEGIYADGEVSGLFQESRPAYR